MDFNTLLQYFPGYQGWDPTAAMADYRATGGAGKGGSGVAMGSGGVPTFSFDYEAEARKAYGELGAYYNRLLEESRGDLTKVLARLVEDYDRGLRIRKEDLTFGQETYDLAQSEAERQAKLSRDRLKSSALARGFYQKSAFDPNGGYGIPDTELREFEEGFDYQTQSRRRLRDRLFTGFNRYKEEADIARKRKEVDLPEDQRRYEHNLEQQRRVEAANMASTRGQRAYQDYLTKFTNLE